MSVVFEKMSPRPQVDLLKAGKWASAGAALIGGTLALTREFSTTPHVTASSGDFLMNTSVEALELGTSAAFVFAGLDNFRNGKKAKGLALTLTGVGIAALTTLLSLHK